ncbi:MAG: MFS transporter [Calditrichaceae bacterium]|nr:MFS transporter [Calditrichaceae bacterium]MBN2710241.1 MFS transporter [Calditrichaceae bacterium]RQV93865.1 MAG: MFS transporter [Calditrichota bacterium]
MLRSVKNLYLEAYSGLPREAWLLSLVMLINRSGTMVLVFLSLYLTVQKGFSTVEAGRLIGLFGFGSMIGCLLGGWLCDRIGALRIQFISLFFGGLGFIILGYMDSGLSIALALFFSAIVNESLRPANITAMTHVCSPELMARGFALNRLALNLGMAVGPAMGGFLVMLNYSYLFWIDGLTCIFASFVLLYFFRRLDIGIQSDTQNSVNAKNPLRDGFYLFLLLIMLSIGLVFSQVFSTWTLYLKKFSGLFEYHIGLLMTLNTLMITAVEMPLIHKTEKYGALKMIRIGTVFLFAGFAVLPLSSGLLWAAFTVFIWTIGEMLVFPLIGSFIARRAPAVNRGKYMALYTLTFSVSHVIGPVAGTYIYDTLHPDAVWYFAGGLGILAVTGLTYAERINVRKHDSKSG